MPHVPSLLGKLLDADKALTKKFCEICFSTVPELNGSYRKYLKALEISCHGIPWLASTLITIYILTSTEQREIEINILFALIMDLVIVALIKATTRRSRPVTGLKNDMFLTVGVDKFSFPSGHATRAVLLSIFFSKWVFNSIIVDLFLYTWAAAVCISRVVLRRHHILDVVGGVLIGYIEYILMGIFWIGPVASKYLGDWISTTSEDEGV